MGQAMQTKIAPMHVRLKVALAGVVLSTAIVSAEQAVGATIAGGKTPQTVGAAAKKTAKDIKSLINGVARDGAQARIPNATVRLRNLEINNVEQVVTANEFGEFSFVAQPNVSYVVEIADRAGRVVAVSDVVVANAGEVAGTVVSLPGRLPALAGVFSNTASSVISAAANSGLTVIDPAQPKVSPTR
jgi:hypothetical protein